jgi:VanZ family protein
MLVLFVAQMWPNVPAPPRGLGDKDEHFFFYGILSVLALRALVKGQWRRMTVAAALGAIAYSSLYGVFLEFCQRLSPPRSYEVLDMVADTIGSAIGVGLAWAWSIIRRRSETPHAL